MEPATVLLWLAASLTKPELVVRASPKLSIATVNEDCRPALASSVLVSAQIKGPETESLYCPAVEWTWPDGTASLEESDCPPYAEREFFPKLWTKRVCLPSHPKGLDWEITVRLSKSGKTVAQQSVTVTVK